MHGGAPELQKYGPERCKSRLGTGRRASPSAPNSLADPGFIPAFSVRRSLLLLFQELIVTDASRFKERNLVSVLSLVEVAIQRYGCMWAIAGTSGMCI